MHWIAKILLVAFVGNPRTREVKRLARSYTANMLDEITYASMLFTFISPLPGTVTLAKSFFE